MTAKQPSHKLSGSITPACYSVVDLDTSVHTARLRFSAVKSRPNYLWGEFELFQPAQYRANCRLNTIYKLHCRSITYLAYWKCALSFKRRVNKFSEAGTTWQMKGSLFFCHVWAWLNRRGGTFWTPFWSESRNQRHGWRFPRDFLQPRSVCKSRGSNLEHLCESWGTIFIHQSVADLAQSSPPVLLRNLLQTCPDELLQL